MKLIFSMLATFGILLAPTLYASSNNGTYRCEGEGALQSAAIGDPSEAATFILEIDMSSKVMKKIEIRSRVGFQASNVEFDQNPNNGTYFRYERNRGFMSGFKFDVIEDFAKIRFFLNNDPSSFYVAGYSIRQFPHLKTEPLQCIKIEK